MNRILEHISSDCSGDSPLCWLIRHSGMWHAPDLRVINYERACLANQKEVTGELETQQPKLMCSNTTDVWKCSLLADLNVCFWYGCCAQTQIQHILYSTADITTEGPLCGFHSSIMHMFMSELTRNCSPLASPSHLHQPGKMFILNSPYRLYESRVKQDWIENNLGGCLL